MKINQIIRERRKELSLTQEQIAEYLGVSAPAVSKWETGSTYPDITLLPALARLLNTDLNTLLSFHDDLSDVEIENFVNEIDKIVREQNYETAFQTAISKIQEYPACEKLLSSVVLYLEEAIFLYRVPDSEHYREILEAFYERMSASKVDKIRESAIRMLISYNRNRGNFTKAEELINALPSSSIDKEEQLATLYTQQGKYPEAEKIWERRVLNAVTEIQTALIHMMEIALKENRDPDAAFYADMHEMLSNQFYPSKWISFVAQFELAVIKQDKEKCLSILQSMLPAMKEAQEARHPQDCPLYRKIGWTDSTFFSNQMLDIILQELMTSEEFSFIRGTEEFNLIKEVPRFKCEEH